ncbi:MAG: helix-turn-helix transcriptional regulator [Methylotenera sp.]|jgi:DNA-binding NarL/FixJ family response regulator|nr:helix-turn-helix transcriptional regulator [Methylotenera sp.]
MKNADSNTFNVIPLLEMDQVKLVHIYSAKLSQLTKKQRVVFDLLSNGMLVKDIAKHLGLAEITVKVVKARVMVILGVTTLQELAVVGKCSACQYIKSHL